MRVAAVRRRRHAHQFPGSRCETRGTTAIAVGHAVGVRLIVEGEALTLDVEACPPHGRIHRAVAPGR